MTAEKHNDSEDVEGDRKRVLECPNCGNQIRLEKPRIGGTYTVRCQSGPPDDKCYDEMFPVDSERGTEQ